MTFRTRTILLAAAATFLIGTNAIAAEISVISGLYRTSEEKSGGKSAGKESTINAGGRYADELGPRTFWFGEGDLTLKSYSAGAGGSSPSNSTGLRAAGGVRYYFDKLSEAVSPYAYGRGTFKNETSVERLGGASYTEAETNGLFYSGHLGVRFNLQAEYFFEVESELFESALFATTKSTTFVTDATTGTVTKSESETNRTEIYAYTTGSFGNMLVAFGMRL